jgi:hypothetical protein
VDSRTVTRRDVLATSSALAVASLAGCAAIDDYPNEDVTTGARLWLPIDHPSLEEYDTKTIDGSIATVEYNTNIILYNDVDLEQLLVERTGGHFTKSPARILGTIYVQTSGFGSSLANRATGQVRDRLGTELREEMRAYGIVNVTETETGDSTRREYSGEVPIKDFHSFDGDGLTDLQDSFEDVAGQMYCGFGLRVDEQDRSALRGFLWIQPTGTYSVERADPDLADDLLVLVPGRSRGSGGNDADSGADSLGEITIEDELELSISTMQISTNSQRAMRR